MNGLGRLAIAILYLLLLVDVAYKSSHLNCSPTAPWYLQAMEHECQELKEKLEEQKRQEKSPRHDEVDD